jgi:MYXO-CTERM domain-containing protein
MRQLIALAALMSAVPANATVLFAGDFETGDISQWSKAQIVAPDRIQIVTSPRRQGAYAARVEVRQGDDPINASGNRAELVWSKNPEQEGNERWYGWSTLWPDDYPSQKTWQLFVQWHHSGCCGSPPVELYVNGETMSLRLNASQVVWNEPLVRGKWHDFVMHVKWSSDPKIGYVELWYDGKLALPKTYAPNMYAGEVNYLKMGLYRNATIQPTGVIFHDGMTVATTQAEVQPPPPAPLPEQDAGAEPDSGDDCEACAGAPGVEATAGAAGALDSSGTGGSGASGSGGSGGSASGGTSGADAGAAHHADGAGEQGSCSMSGKGRPPLAPLAALALLLCAIAGRRRRRH